MKVALCISGQPRNVERGFPFIKDNIIDVNDPDVFIHAWVDDSIIGPEIRNSGNHIASSPIPSDIDDIILKLYCPVDYIFEPQREFDERDYNIHRFPGIVPKNSLSQRFSVRESIYLALEHSAYDVIIRMRFDWAIGVPVDMRSFDTSRIIVPSGCPHPGGLNDQFAFSNTSNMVHYANLYDDIDVIWRGGVSFCDELLLAAHLNRWGVPFKEVYFPFDILRG